ncbi:SDR family oxidoreductase [Arthrobacter sp. StoSoilB20]|uniref:SDR family NAD(P)-dependent oxidoreductase n=1 Tax=Arthrobacter sp. StoSoilB20 TaxID=2830995 RepID=UPI001CC802CA|nr:SDR family oxidoreductase [Arthrobacter sp. StoSoilB20]BCW58592.1 3-oxoacyl-ACP reductase [Arthrobacter sp. StoSoilB20]
MAKHDPIERTTGRRGLNVVITGAAGGMCRGINQRLGKAGHTLLCVDLDLKRCQAAVDELRAEGFTAHAFAADVTRAEDVERLRGDVKEVVGEVQALINAAGVLDRKMLLDHDIHSFSRAIDINLVGPFALIRAFAEDLLAANWGRIVNVSSIAGTTGYPYPSYAASKAGLSNLTRSLLVDFWGTGITVNSVCPGVVDTPMVIQEVRDQVPNKVPTGKIVDPDEIGALITFLLTDDARSINGADLVIDGGATKIFRLFDHAQG